MVACGWAGADLDQVGVPGILGDAQVVVALFLFQVSVCSGGDDDAACVPSWCLCQRHGLRVLAVQGAGLALGINTHDTWKRARIGLPLLGLGGRLGEVKGKNDGVSGLWTAGWWRR